MSSDDSDTKEAIFEAMKTGAKLTTTGQIGLMVHDMLTDEEGQKDKSADELLEEERRNELAMEIKKARARAAQELAIAERIRTATEVEIEEYYSGEGEGDVGVRGDAKTESVTIGAHGAGKKVTRRVVRLKGWAPSEGAAESSELKPETAKALLEENEGSK